MSDNRGRGGQRGRGGGDRGGRGGGGRGGNQGEGGGRGGMQGGRGAGGRGRRGGYQGGEGGRAGMQGGRGNSPVRGGERGGYGGGQRVDGRGRGRGRGDGQGGHQNMPILPSPAAQEPLSDDPPPGVYLAGTLVPEPDAGITDLENKLVAVTKGQTFDLGDKGAKVPGRRGYGTKGTHIILRTNYFKIDTDAESKTDLGQTWYRYDVALAPEPSKQKTRRLFDKIVNLGMFEGVLWASDYAKIIVTTKKLDLGDGVEWKSKTVIPAENHSATSDEPTSDLVREARARNTVEVRIRLTGSFTLNHIIDYLKSTSPGAQYAGTPDVIQLFNIIMCKPPNGTANVRSVGKGKFYPYEGHPGLEKRDLGEGLQAMRGYFSSVRPAVGRLLLNLNVTAGAFYKPIHLLDLKREFGPDNVAFEAFVRMVKVRAVYIKDQQKEPFMTKIKTIVGFAKENLPRVRVQRMGNANQVKFSYQNINQPNAPARQVTVAEYFKQHHGITLRQPREPVLNVGTRADPQYLPMELCTVLSGQPHNRLLAGEQTKKMLLFAARTPNANALSIAGTSQAPGNGSRLFRLRDPSGDPQVSSVQPWGFSVNVKDMVTVPGRRLVTPKVKYGTQEARVGFGTWNCDKQKFVRAGALGKWQVLVINRNQPESLFQTLENYLRAYGLTWHSRGPTETIQLDKLIVPNRATNDRILAEAYANAKEAGVNFLLVVLPAADKWLYARIKHYGDITYGIQTICSVGSKLSKPQNQGMYMGNLALKFNIKAGGINHTVPNTLTTPLGNDTMLMGIDVTHPSPGSKEGAPSIACVVASIDQHLTQWPGSVRTQTGRQEMVDALDDMVVERLRLWQKKNQNRLPNKIVLYRDGVSEGQYDQVLLLELPSFVKAFERVYGDVKKHPKLAVIVVGKRHHTRFYPTREQDADTKHGFNPLPGTIVDRHIGNKILGEFWLQAHQGLQGTARPAHYVILKDDIGFEADQLQGFTHNLCYLFNRATKAVSICPPAYYADLLCERGRCYLFSTLAESHGTDSGVFDASANWTGGVHANLAETTWYI